MNQETKTLSIVMLGASGAVGTQAVNKLLTMSEINQLTILGRRQSNHQHEKINDNIVDVLDSSTYDEFLSGHEVAICTLGVGEPSKISREEFTKVDFDAVLEFAKACKVAGVKHFQLLSSVAVNVNSRSFFLRSKGLLNAELEALGFDQLSIFHPSMIETPKNRYGVSQAIALSVSRLMKPLLLGSLKQYRGVEVSVLGSAIAVNSLSLDEGLKDLYWSDFYELVDDF